MGILVVSTFYEIAKTVVDYQMKSQASLIYDETGFQWFQGIYGISSNGLGFLYCYSWFRICYEKIRIKSLFINLSSSIQHQPYLRSMLST